MTRHRWDHHPACPCGCGELADECAGPSPRPLGSMVVEAPATGGRPSTRSRVFRPRPVETVALPEPSQEELARRFMENQDAPAVRAFLDDISETEAARRNAWDLYRHLHPEVLASWGESNGRWPHPSDMPAGYVRPEA